MPEAAEVLGRRNPNRDSRQEALRPALADLGTGLVLEIGCGHGHFLTAYGQAHPDRRCVGVDINQERVERAERKRARAGLPNVRFVRADIEDFLAALPPGSRFAAVFLLFPDPWPKRRHHKNRLMQISFLDSLAEHCLPQARLYFRSDHAGYCRDAARALAGCARWSIVDEPWPFEFATIFQARASHHQSLIAQRER
ncbi:MAG TPA: methyltransferase domain-containing protein [Opitutaceae bacterium]|jgi:tRNA (guanine-N7-)-methyltransferase|nr:methyltransferase domain-containing protein [Opitutaceae bacterium]